MGEGSRVGMELRLGLESDSGWGDFRPEGSRAWPFDKVGEFRTIGARRGRCVDSPTGSEGLVDAAMEEGAISGV